MLWLLADEEELEAVMDEYWESDPAAELNGLSRGSKSRYS